VLRATTPAGSGVFAKSRFRLYSVSAMGAIDRWKR
jgi:hypothetical protein